MARNQSKGSTQLRSEARSPEVQAFRNTLKTTKNGIPFNEVMEKDPTLKAVFSNPKFIKDFDKEIQRKIEDALPDPPDSGFGTESVDSQQYFEIGNRIFELVTAPFDVNWEAGRRSISDYDSDINNAKELLAESKIREIDPDSDEAKKLSGYTLWNTPNKAVLPNDYGINNLTPWDETSVYKGASKLLGMRREDKPIEITENPSSKRNPFKVEGLGDRGVYKTREDAEAAIKGYNAAVEIKDKIDSIMKGNNQEVPSDLIKTLEKGREANKR